MALKVRSADASASRFVTNAGNATQAYKQGVQNAGQDWERATLDSKDNWQAGVQAAATRGAFAKGVAKSGAGYYQQRATDLGGNRYAGGVVAGKDNYIEGVTPYLTVLQNANLTPRGPRGSAQNAARAQEVSQLLNIARTGQKS